MAEIRGFVEEDPPSKVEERLINAVVRDVVASQSEGLPRDVAGDLRILRYLRGRLHIHEEACDLFGRTLEWREQEERFDVSLIHSRMAGMTPEHFQRRSHRGSVVMLFKYGQWDVESAVRDFGPHSVLEAEVERLEWTMWYLDELTRKEGRMRYMMGIIDLEHAGAHQLRGHTRRVMMEAGRLLAFAYVDSLEVILCVNAPWIFSAIWATASPLLTARQKAKFHLLGSSRSETVRKVLRATIPPEILPRDYGGTAEPDLWGTKARQEMEARKRKRQHSSAPKEASGSSFGVTACCFRRSLEAPIAEDEDVILASQASVDVELPTHGAKLSVAELKAKVMNGDSSTASWQFFPIFWGMVIFLLLLAVRFFLGR